MSEVGCAGDLHVRGSVQGSSIARRVRTRVYDPLLFHSRVHDEAVEDRVPERGLLAVPDEVWALAVRRAEVIGVKSTEVVYRLVILRLLGQAVRAGSSGWATTSSGVCGSPTRRAAARASSPR